VDFDVDQRRRLRSVVEILSRAFRGWWRDTSSKFSKMTLGHPFGGPIFSRQERLKGGAALNKRQCSLRPSPQPIPAKSAGRTQNLAARFVHRYSPSIRADGPHPGIVVNEYFELVGISLLGDWTVV
jgi:hypothetical protein